MAKRKTPTVKSPDSAPKRVKTVGMPLRPSKAPRQNSKDDALNAGPQMPTPPGSIRNGSQTIAPDQCIHSLVKIFAEEAVSYLLDLLRPSPRCSLPDTENNSSAQNNPMTPPDLLVRRRQPIYATPPVPDDLAIDPVDSNYLHFFFLHSPMFLLFAHHFPSAPSAIWDLACKSKPLLHSILGVASQHADMFAGRPCTRAFYHLSKCLPELQKALSTRKINESHIAAVYCLARLHFARRERNVARNHLRGLFLMLEAYQQGEIGDDTSSPGGEQQTEVTPRRNPSPFMMLLWRIAIQMDLGIGNRGQDLVFSSPAYGQDELHRAWILRISSLENVECALAEFALDDLYHHTLATEKLAARLRSSPLYDPEHDEAWIQEKVAKLWDMHRQWKKRLIVNDATLKERFSPLKASELAGRESFLHYRPPLAFGNDMFTRMLIYHTERVIQIDRICHPDLRMVSGRRLRAAIEVCRIIAGLKSMKGDGIGQYFQGLNSAGLVFDPAVFPKEFEWVVEKLYEVDRVSGYDSGHNLANALREMWKSDDPWGTYQRLTGRSAPS